MRAQKHRVHLQYSTHARESQVPFATTSKIQTEKEHSMTPYKTRKPKIVTVALRLAICLAFMLGIVFASPTFAVYAKDGTQIDTLGVAFGKVNVGDSLADAFEFENEAEGTLKVPSGANYTATLLFISKKGQAITLWEKDKASFPWSGVENQLVEKNVAYCIRVRFSPKENYQLSKDVALC